MDDWSTNQLGYNNLPLFMMTNSYIDEQFFHTKH